MLWLNAMSRAHISTKKTAPRTAQRSSDDRPRDGADRIHRAHRAEQDRALLHGGELQRFYISARSPPKREKKATHAGKEGHDRDPEAGRADARERAPKDEHVRVWGGRADEAADLEEGDAYEVDVFGVVDGEDLAEEEHEARLGGA